MLRKNGKTYLRYSVTHFYYSGKLNTPSYSLFHYLQKDNVIYSTQKNPISFFLQNLVMEIHALPVWKGLLWNEVIIFKLQIYPFICIPLWKAKDLKGTTWLLDQLMSVLIEFIPSSLLYFFWRKKSWCYILLLIINTLQISPSKKIWSYSYRPSINSSLAVIL